MGKKKLAILTGGGDCPGLNAAIRAIVIKSLSNNYEVLGLLNGWSGLKEKNFKVLDYSSVSGILHIGGTILGTSRTNVFKDEDSITQTLKSFDELELDGLVAIGGEGTLSVAQRLFEKGLKVVGAPKTIDNDIDETDFTFGFDTAVEIATEAIDRLHTTAESHRRAMVVEVMGRHAGWIATYAGLAGGADIILTPEKPLSIEDITTVLERRKKRGKTFSIVVVAEGASIIQNGKKIVIHKDRTDEFGRHQLGGIGQTVADLIEEHLKMEARVTVLGHVQRGGTPTAHDRVLATRYGAYAAELVFQEKWGHMASLKGNTLKAVSLKNATQKLKTVSEDLFKLTSDFCG